jgi:hypothetical protein
MIVVDVNGGTKISTLQYDIHLSKIVTFLKIIYKVNTKVRPEMEQNAKY